MKKNGITAATGEFQKFLIAYYQDGQKGELKQPLVYESDIQVQLVNDEGKNPLRCIWSGSKSVFIIEKAIPKLENEEETTEDSISPDSKLHFKEALGPMPLAVMKARQLISWYTMAHNPNMPQLVNASCPAVVLPPVWVRCDSSDPEGTCWLGAETIRTDSKVTGINFHSVTCKGPVIGKASFINLDELKKAHKGRHHSSTVTTKGYAQYDLFGSTVVESSIIESQSSVVVDFTWNNVENILQTPPLTSAATLNIRVGSGDQRSPVYHLFKELEFLIVLAEGLKTGETDWPEPLETKTAVELVRALIEDLKNKFDVYQKQPAKESEKIKSDAASVEGSIQTAFVTDRGDLDFAEQLWSRMRRSVASYRDVVDSLTLVIQALKFGDIQPWIHRGSSSSLSKLIQQSYHGNMDNFSLTGLAPIRMLLEVGLDKMRKDYINYFIGQELTTLNYLDYFLSSSVDVQEQVQRLKKLHHMLEIVVNCNAFLNLAHEHLFPLTQSCLQFYKKHPYSEEHVFHLQIRPSVISSFYQNEHPQTWRVEVSSGHGQKEVKTTWQLSGKAPVEHVGFDIPDIPFETTINGEDEEPAYFTTMISCSQVHFM
ncbi:protein zwilch homolog [Acipenser ruthenus]|uniref:protein zwilch homolog n=1 Tax=Acipenser ruthenus TaxID=7906 RepID=UPI00274137B5|nr:protein zwilch homolog [Acipenser ruthenus]